MGMDMVRPWKDPWGLSPSLRPLEARTVLTDLCGRSRLVAPPQLSCDSYVGRVCHSHCGGDRRSRQPVHLVWVNGSLGCRKITARTQNYILHTLPAFTSIYRSYLSASKESDRFFRNDYRLFGEWESCGDPEPNVSLRRPPVPCGCPGYPLPCLGVIEPPVGLL